MYLVSKESIGNCSSSSSSSSDFNENLMKIPKKYKKNANLKKLKRRCEDRPR